LAILGDPALMISAAGSSLRIASAAGRANFTYAFALGLHFQNGL